MITNAHIINATNLIFRADLKSAAKLLLFFDICKYFCDFLLFLHFLKSGVVKMQKVRSIYYIYTMYIYAFYTRNLAILWVSYWYVMGILWLGKVPGRLLPVVGLGMLGYAFLHC